MGTNTHTHAHRNLEVIQPVPDPKVLRLFPDPASLTPTFFSRTHSLFRPLRVLQGTLAAVPQVRVLKHSPPRFFFSLSPTRAWVVPCDPVMFTLYYYTPMPQRVCVCVCAKALGIQKVNTKSPFLISHRTFAAAETDRLYFFFRLFIGTEIPTSCIRNPYVHNLYFTSRSDRINTVVSR